ncbi:MAG: ATP synthase subunit I [Pyrinomonadaceae bacterium]|nr:ATP synthase subunit I [Pyrinomonadaceae bacterium]
MTSEAADSVNHKEFAAEDTTLMERRIFRSMCLTVGLAVVLSALIAPWRVTTGLLLGGVLSIFNHHWLRTSVAAAFAPSTAGGKPNIGALRFVLRYIVLAAVITLAYLSNIASLTAMLVGLCAFVVAALVEAFMQMYFIVIHGKGN